MAAEPPPAPPESSATQGLSPQVQVDNSKASGYDRCWDGRVCLFEGWHGTGKLIVLDGCNMWLNLDFLSNITSSVRTHGNPVWLYDYQSSEYVGYIPAWTTTNLASWESDRADTAYVVC